MAPAKKDGETRSSPERRPTNAQWNAVDCPQRSAVEGIAGSVWSLAVCVRPICQMARRRRVGNPISSAVRRRGYGKSEFGLYLRQSSRKRQWRGKKTADKAIGRTKGGLNTKLHAIVDGLGNPIEFLLSAGNDHDSVHAIELLGKVKISGSHIIADRAYGAKTIRTYISEQGADYVIPPQSNVSNPWSIDWRLYKERHLVECFFQKLKWFRRISTRYDKLDISFLAFVYLASIAILLI